MLQKAWHCSTWARIRAGVGSLGFQASGLVALSTTEFQGLGYRV